MALIGPGGRPLSTAPATAPAGSNPAIKDTTLATFAADVLEASAKVPVIVDFWAPWCGPCRTLGPLLEKAVADSNGAVVMVKVNIDDNPEIAQQLHIQSIPTVYAFKGGQPVDGFMGAVSEAQVRAFVSQLASGDAAHAHAHDHGSPEHEATILKLADDSLAEGDIGTAAQAYGHLLQDSPGLPRAVAGLAACYLKSGDVERARATLQLVKPDGADDPAIRAMEAELKLKQSAAPTEGMAALEARLAADANDHAARYDLALALDVAGNRDAALDQFLEIVRRDRKWNDEAAKNQVMTLFEAMGPTDPRTIAGRRKLSSLLFS